MKNLDTKLLEEKYYSFYVFLKRYSEKTLSFYYSEEESNLLMDYSKLVESLAGLSKMPELFPRAQILVHPFHRGTVEISGLNLIKDEDEIIFGLNQIGLPSIVGKSYDKFIWLDRTTLNSNRPAMELFHGNLNQHNKLESLNMRKLNTTLALSMTFDSNMEPKIRSLSNKSNYETSLIQSNQLRTSILELVKLPD